MEKLNNVNYFLGDEKFPIGDVVSETGVVQVSNNYIPRLYYKSGIKEIDDFFMPDGYVKNKYICTLTASELVVSLFFLKHNETTLIDMGVAHISRNKIIGYDKSESQQVEVIKFHEARSMFKTIAKRKMGLAGLLGGAIADKFVPVDTEFVKGYEYKLNYLDKNNNQQQIVIYADDQNSYYVSQLLIKYFKKTE